MNRMSIVPIIVQASTVKESLRGRCFLKLNTSDTVIDFLLIRLIKRYGKYQIILAVSDLPDDDVFQEVAARYDIFIYRGDYDNLALRLREAVRLYAKEVEHFVRIQANAPLVDFNLLDDLLAHHMEGRYEYSYNEYLNGVLWGMGCEVFSTDLIEQLANMQLRKDQLVLLGGYLRQNIDKYRTYAYPYKQNRSLYKVNIETEKDLEVVRELVANLSDITVELVSSYLDSHKLLAKYNRQFPLKETGTEKLLLNEEKVKKIRKNLDVDYSYPISVELTLTNRCNLACVYCSDMELRRRQGMGEKLSKEVLFSLFDDLARGGTRGIVLEGGGEPTLYDGFSEVVQYARKSGLAVGLITNGTQELKPHLLEQFEWIRVSLDASTAEEYQALKGVDCFENVISNIAKYAQHCPSVGVGYVVTNKNISQIEPLVMRLRELDVSYIQCRPVVDNEEIYPRGIDLSYLTFYQNEKFGVMVDGMIENAEGGNHGLPCYAHSITSIISGDGSVYICGRLNIYDWLKPIGNIREHSFHSIWNGDERKRQAQQIKDASFCNANCPQCRISKFNVLFDKLSSVKSVNFI